jgi:hypothetical protein
LNKKDFKEKCIKALDVEGKLDSALLSTVNEKKELVTLAVGNGTDFLEMGLATIYEVLHHMGDFESAKELVVASIMAMTKR